MPRPYGRHLREVSQRLTQVFGEPPKRPRPDAIAELVSTILSQNTNDALRDKAYSSLRQRFPTWEQVSEATEEELADAIRIAGLSQHKAPTIQRALQRIHAERGDWTLDFLRGMPVEDAKQWLTSIKGIGPKTAAIVLLFALDVPAFPVDTHIHRVTRRLGLIPAKASREKAHELLEAIFPPKAYFAAHLNLIRLGREVCRARKPRCEECVLSDLCDYYANTPRPTACSAPTNPPE